MFKACEGNAFLFQEAFEPHWDDHVLRMRLQPACASITCLELPKNVYLS